MAGIVLTLPLFVEPSSWLVRRLVVREHPLPSDAIIVLLGGAAFERVELAHSFYQQKFAPRIIFCNGFEVSGWKSWWYRKRGWVPFGKSFRRYLRSRKVSDSAIEMLECPGIHDTASEMRAIASRISNRGYRRVLLVTSASHSRRANLVWKRTVPSIAGIMIGARDAGMQWWWSTRRGRTTVLYEYLALAKELIRQHTDF